MARLSISLTDEILEQLKETKPSHRPMSQHIADLLLEGLNATERSFSKRFSEQLANIAAQEAGKKGLSSEDSNGKL
jgi:hypothetical protein